MATDVYYSVCPFGTGDLKTGSPTLTISSGVATLSVAQTGNIGAGCRITYDGSLIAYISAITSSTVFSVITATGGTPSDEGTPVTVNSIGHEYASLQVAENGADDANHLNTSDLPANDFLLHLVCYKDHDDQTKDTTGVYYTGWTTDGTRFIVTETPHDSTESILNQRHSLAYDTNLYALEPSSSFTLRLNMGHVLFDGLQLKAFATYSSGNILGTANGDVWRFTDCICQGNAQANARFFRCAGLNANSEMHTWNTLIYDMTGSSSAAIQLNDGQADIGIYNVTIRNCTVGLDLDAVNQEYVVNVAMESVTTPFSGTFTDPGGDAFNDYNYVDADTSSHVALGPNGADNQDMSSSFAAAGSGILASGDTVLAENGYDIATNPDTKTLLFQFTDDALGTTRPVSTDWDVGAHERPAVAAGNPWYAYANQMAVTGGIA